MGDVRKSPPCLWCKRTEVHVDKDGKYQAECNFADCWATGPMRDTPDEAFEAWASISARVSRLAKENAELVEVLRVLANAESNYRCWYETEGPRDVATEHAYDDMKAAGDRARALTRHNETKAVRK